MMVVTINSITKLPKKTERAINRHVRLHKFINRELCIFTFLVSFSIANMAVCIEKQKEKIEKLCKDVEELKDKKGD